MKHSALCKTNLSCAVYHENGICPDKKVCDCGAEGSPPTTGCCERCRIDGDFMGEAYCQESDCPNCHQEKAGVKICSKCKFAKPLSDFRTDNTTKDGYHYVCRTCTKMLDRERYRENKSKNPKIVAEKSKRNYDLHPERHRIRAALRYAVKTGKVTKLPCEVCGEPKSSGHHDDYSKPLEVRWLCHTHHMEHHHLEAARQNNK